MLRTQAQADRDDTGGGVHLGRVTRVTGPECYVEVPTVARGFEYGPARYPATNLPTTTGTANSHAHGLAALPLAAGDRVAVAFLDGGTDDLVVLVRLT